jgi:GNAT superfamily N-acetyltransferase
MNDREPPSRPILLAADHDVGDFECGIAPLDAYLKRHALADQVGYGSRTYVALRGDRVVAYHTLAPAHVRRDEATLRLLKGQGAHPVGVVLLARLAVDRREQGRGLGGSMLLDAFARALSAAEVIGGRAIAVHAMDESARTFYRHLGFEPSPADPLHLYVLMRDVRRTLEA